MYKITEHQFVIRFIPSTCVVEVQVDAPVIKSDKFVVRRFDHLQVLANTNLELPGVLSSSLQGCDLNNSETTTRMWSISSLILPLLCTCLNSANESQSVMVVTTVNPKIFGGHLYAIKDYINCLTSNFLCVTHTYSLHLGGWSSRELILWKGLKRSLCQ
ncbi:hypothetical protein Bca52824_022982 [Brassica carinata]|uniref:Uncharacterized protein n=1 Tax=Brassica carinata TaxID=52824 RepID=A0A8X8ASG2_BRACI|nr:hypothetical protein Bca52824_022982 [Brassica carinata]